MVATDLKPKPFPFTGVARLDGLEINIVSKQDLFDEKFVLILKEYFFNYNTTAETPLLSYSNYIAQVFIEFRDVRTNELQKELPPEKEVDHKIELVLRA